MLRIALFLGTNFAILLILSVSMSILGIEGVLDEQGVGLDLNSLLIMSSIIGFSGSIISLFISKWMAKKSMGVKIISTPKNDTEKWLLSINKELSQKANINVPEFGIFDSKQPNAFATGSSKNNSLVAVSTGLLVTMNKDEVEAVVAHEICHISNGDMVTMSLIQGIINTFVIFFSRIIGHLVDRLVFKVQRGHGPAYFITSIIAQIVLSILASIIVMWFSRRREYKADSGAALLVGKEKMISALKVLGKQSTDPLPDQMAAFGISGNKKKISSLFSSHPSIEKRISALLNL
ncbi:MAG: protease HtpX [Thiotrichaceae bacterium]|jgi:heat shock protein HtpX|nr:protease HtpX [Pseudomonadota bacterium]MEC9190639.1 protease HtpX [Pseudomonadota bacterium]GIR93097.1 MAG: protease HtpX [Thiotrichaceae bacterium]|tara:strand:- start:1217 stop:2092 length:876 start_codon:yes stop_codon:yes gene_type:complete